MITESVTNKNRQNTSLIIIQQEILGGSVFINDIKSTAALYFHTRGIPGYQVRLAESSHSGLCLNSNGHHIIPKPYPMKLSVLNSQDTTVAFPKQMT